MGRLFSCLTFNRIVIAPNLVVKIARVHWLCGARKYDILVRDAGKRENDMKLSKKNQILQRAIAKALESGKALGGLLAGFNVAVFAGCRNEPHHGLMGKYPASPERQSNATNETVETEAILGEISDVAPESAPKKPNAANEKMSRRPKGEPMPPRK